MMRIAVRGIKEKRGIIYKVPTASLAIWAATGRKRSAFFPDCYTGTKDTCVKIYSTNVTCKNGYTKMYSLRMLFIFVLSKYKKSQTNE